MKEFPRMLRLPPYAFNVIGDIKKKLRHQNIDIVDLSMGNPDPPTPQFIVDKLVEALPVYILRCNMEAESVKAAYEAVSGHN